MQALKAVNEAVIVRSPIVPNPYTLLSQIPPDAACFPVVDLSNVFFCNGEEHNCVAELQVQCSPRPDLSDESLSNSDLTLYVDGSSSRDPVSVTNCWFFCLFR